MSVRTKILKMKTRYSLRNLHVQYTSCYDTYIHTYTCTDTYIKHTKAVAEDSVVDKNTRHVDEEALPLSGPSFLDFIRYNVCVMPGGPGRYTLTVQDSKVFCSEESLCKYGLQKEKNRAVAQGFKRTLKSVEGQTKTLQNKLWDAYEGLDNNRHVRSFGNVNFTADTKDLVMALIPTSHQL